MEKKEEQTKNPITNKKWLYVSFMVPVENTFGVINSGLQADNPTEAVMSSVIAPASQIEEKHVTVSEEYPPDVSVALNPDKQDPFPVAHLQGLPFAHVKFVDKREEDSEIEEFEIRSISREEGKNYAFTPKNFIKYAEKKIFTNIEFQLVTLFNLPQIHDEHQKRQDQSYLTFSEGRPVHTKSDGVYMYKYLIEDRIKLYKQNRKLENKVFANVNLPYFIDWLMDRREANEHMEKYCSKVEDLLDKHNVTLKGNKRGIIPKIKEFFK